MRRHLAGCCMCSIPPRGLAMCGKLLCCLLQAICLESVYRGQRATASQTWEIHGVHVCRAKSICSQPDLPSHLSTPVPPDCGQLPNCDIYHPFIIIEIETCHDSD